MRVMLRTTGLPQVRSLSAAEVMVVREFGLGDSRALATRVRPPRYRHTGRDRIEWASSPPFIMRCARGDAIPLGWNANSRASSPHWLDVVSESHRGGFFSYSTAVGDGLIASRAKFGQTALAHAVVVRTPRIRVSRKTPEPDNHGALALVTTEFDEDVDATR